MCCCLLLSRYPVVVVFVVVVVDVADVDVVTLFIFLVAVLEPEEAMDVLDDDVDVEADFGFVEWCKCWMWLSLNEVVCWLLSLLITIPGHRRSSVQCSHADWRIFWCWFWYFFTQIFINIPGVNFTSYINEQVLFLLKTNHWKREREENMRSYITFYILYNIAYLDNTLFATKWTKR